MRRLSTLDILAIGVNAIVGSGVFSLPDDMAREMGRYSPLAFVICAVLLWPVALCFAELARNQDQNGGPYVYARAAFGERIGFLIGWLCWTNAFISFAANVGLLVALLGTSGAWARVLVVVIVVALGGVNHFGVQPGARLVQVLVLGKLVAIASFVLAGITFASHTTQSGGASAGGLPHGFQGVANGVYLALFPFQGFEVIAVPAGETKNPERAVPRATLGSLALAAVLYVVVQALLTATYPDLARPSETPLVDAARRIGPALGVIVFVGSIVSVGGFAAGSALGSPRYAQAMAAHNQLPRTLALLHPKWGSPTHAIWATTFITAILAALFSYRTLVGFSNISVVVQYACTCAAVPMLRKPGQETSLWQRAIPVLGVLFSLAFLYGANMEEFVFALGAIAFGVVFYAVRAGRQHAT